jgi:ADP-ribose pyrophosphatase YjhB (NUDIX family)
MHNRTLLPLPHFRAGPNPRLGARLLLLDGDDRVLLMHARDPAEPTHEWWELPGGGLADGEDTAAACRRELAEETGITAVELGPVVWQRESVFRYREREHHRFDWVHVARLAGGGRQARCWTANEKTTVLGERWWTLAELNEAVEVRFLPRRLATLLSDVLAGGHERVVQLYEDTR